MQQRRKKCQDVKTAVPDGESTIPLEKKEDQK